MKKALRKILYVWTVSVIAPLHCGAITTPTLVIWDEQDHFISLDSGKRFAREIPGARLQIIPNTGHDVQFESPEPFNKVLIEFLSDTHKPTKEQ